MECPHRSLDEVSQPAVSSIPLPSSLTSLHRPCVLASWGSSSWPLVWALCLPPGPQDRATWLNTDLVFGPHAHVCTYVEGLGATLQGPSSTECGRGWPPRYGCQSGVQQKLKNGMISSSPGMLSLDQSPIP